MNADLAMICGKCRGLIDGESGFIGVRHRSVTRAQSGPDPEDALWEALHYGCDPDPANDCYQIATERIATWPALMWWTAHLMGKTWLGVTDWDDVLREVAGEGGPNPRITVRLRSVA